MLLDLLLDFRSRNGQNVSHGSRKALEGFWSFYVFRFVSHVFIMAQSVLRGKLKSQPSNVYILDWPCPTGGNQNHPNIFALGLAFRYPLGSSCRIRAIGDTWQFLRRIKDQK